MVNEFKKKYPLEKRKEESKKIREKYPERYPIIVTKDKGSTLNNIDKSKFLGPDSLTLGQFLHIVRKKIELNDNETLFLFINGSILVNNSETIGNIYNIYKDEDGFLYITYCNENVFGK
jgi:GABA(A) receptor-associated protein